MNFFEFLDAAYNKGKRSVKGMNAALEDPCFLSTIPDLSPEEVRGARAHVNSFVRDELTEALNDLDEEEKIDLWNEWCEEESCYRYVWMIHKIEELDDFLCDKTPTEILDIGAYGDYEPLHSHFRYGSTLETTNEPLKWIEISDLVDWIMKKENESYYLYLK